MQNFVAAEFDGDVQMQIAKKEKCSHFLFKHLLLENKQLKTKLIIKFMQVVTMSLMNIQDLE